MDISKMSKEEIRQTEELSKQKRQGRLESMGNQLKGSTIITTKHFKPLVNF